MDIDVDIDVDVVDVAGNVVDVDVLFSDDNYGCSFVPGWLCSTPKSRPYSGHAVRLRLFSNATIDLFHSL